MENNAFDFKKFIEDSKQALLNPKDYFSSMTPAGGMGVPVIKALLYGVVAGILNLLWSLLNISPVTGGVFGIVALIWSVVGALIGLFLGAVIILLLVAIAGGKTDFEPTVHVSAALLVIMPVSAFMNIFSGIHFILGTLLSLAVNLYALWMLFNAMTLTLNSKVETSKIIMYVLGGILILFTLIAFGTRRVSRDFMRDVERYQMDFGHIKESNEKPAKLFSQAEFHCLYNRMNRT